MTPEGSQEHDFAENSPEALGLAPIKPEQAAGVEVSANEENPEALRERVNQDIKRSERAPEILARIESLAEASMPIESVVTAHPELAGMHISERFHVTKDNKLIFFTGEKAYLLPSATTFESGEGSIFPTDDDKKLFNGSITKVLEASKYIDSTPIVQHLAVYRYLNLQDPNRETALKAALEQAEKTLDSLAQTLKPEAPAEQETASDAIAPNGALEPSMPSAAQPPAQSQGAATAQESAA